MADALTRKFGKSKAKASLALTNNIQVTIEGAYEDDRQKFQSLYAHLGTVYIGNTVDSSAIDDRVTALESGGALLPIATKTSDYSVLITDRLLLGDATSNNVEFTLPDPSTAYSAGTTIYLAISKIDSSANIVTISPNTTETIAGETSFDLTHQNEVITLVTNGTNWYLKD